MDDPAACGAGLYAYTRIGVDIALAPRNERERQPAPSQNPRNKTQDNLVVTG
jgi:hypothetical protein